MQPLAALPIPQAHQLIVPTGGEYRPIRAEGNRLNLGTIGAERLQQLSGLCVPKTHCLIQAPAHHHQAGWMKADRCDAGGMAGEYMQLL